MIGTSQKLAELIILLFAFGASPVDTMTCGVHKIYGGKIPVQSRAIIRRKCGAPKSTSGNNLYYEKNNNIYRLHFNNNDALKSITVERG